HRRVGAVQRRLRCRSRARRGAGRAARPARSGAGAEHDALAHDAAHHPAASHTGHAAAGGHPADRIAEEHRAGLAHHHRRHDLPWPAAAQRHAAHHGNLRADAAALLCRGAADHRRGAPARTQGAATMNPIFDWSFALQILPLLARALIITVQATAAGMLIAVTLGLLLALARRARWPILSYPAAFFVEFVRSTPLLVQMYF